jgi:hypothetical protein
MKSTEFHHLKIDVDKYPKLKWYFDSKFEPGCHLYYYGISLKNIGGINFERNDRIMKRVISQVKEQPLNLNINQLSWSQPYYQWESDLDEYGTKRPDDAIQSYMATGFRGLQTYTHGLHSEDLTTHVRIKK